MARSFEERQVTEEIIDKEHRNVCIRWPNSSPCRIGVLLESRIQGRLFGSCRMTRHSYDRRRRLGLRPRYVVADDSPGTAQSASARG